MLTILLSTKNHPIPAGFVVDDEIGGVVGSHVDAVEVAVACSVANEDTADRPECLFSARYFSGAG